MIHTPHNKILFRYGEFSYLDPTYLYEYNNTWKDQLSRFTVNGVVEEFEYDNIGLPTQYRNQPMAWNNRNQLSNYNGVTFTYDGTGMRLSKGSTTFEYEGDRLLSESRNGTAVLGTTIGLLGALVIGGLVAVGVGIAGAIAIYYLGDAVDYIYEKFKEWIFEKNNYLSNAFIGKTFRIIFCCSFGTTSYIRTINSLIR